MAQSSSSALHVRRPLARIGADVSQPRRDDPVAALNQVLSEVIDAVLDVRQAHRRVPETHALHASIAHVTTALRRSVSWGQVVTVSSIVAVAT
jgi:hypothetical protein